MMTTYYFYLNILNCTVHDDFPIHILSKLLFKYIDKIRRDIKIFYPASEPYDNAAQS
jgi:hypothetical protein